MPALPSDSQPQKKNICAAATTRSTVTKFPSHPIWMPSSGSPNPHGEHTFAGRRLAKRARHHGITCRACAGGCRRPMWAAIDQSAGDPRAGIFPEGVGHRIEVNVATQFGPHELEFDKDRLKAALKQRPAPAVTAVKPQRVADSKPLHARTQSALLPWGSNSRAWRRARHRSKLW